MNTPTPVDVSKLKNILANAKKVMKATDEQFKPKVQSPISESTKSTSSVNVAPNYNEYDEKDTVFNNNFKTPSTASYVPTNRDYTIDEVRNSKLPPQIKEAMIKNHIPRVTSLPGAFSLEGLEDLIEKPLQPTQRKQINENINRMGSNMITISEQELGELIDKKINESISKLFAKTLAEQTIKRTINTLIKEGKIIKK
jgi:hypothetical protein